MDVDRYSLRGFDCACGNLRMASRAVTAVYDHHLREAGLQASQLAVLWAVAGMGPAPVKDIAAKIVMDETSLLRNLRVLEGRGWVALDVGEDRRQRLASLTPDGREVFARALPLWKKAQDQVAGVLDGKLKEINSQLLRLTRAVG
jgi:DNA-binding MarR family transcriptional regulator